MCIYYINITLRNVTKQIYKLIYGNSKKTYFHIIWHLRRPNPLWDKEFRIICRHIIFGLILTLECALNP